VHAESAPTTKAKTANASRRLTGGYADFDQIRFIARIGIRPAEGQFQARNQVDEIITPDRKDWQKPEQISAKTVAAATAPASAPASSPPAGALARPQWAK